MNLVKNIIKTISCFAGGVKVIYPCHVVILLKDLIILKVKALVYLLVVRII